MKKKMVVNGDTNAQPVAVSTARPAGDQPPTAQAPAPPVGWKPTKRTRAQKGTTVTKAHIDNAESAAAELQASTTYEADFLGQAPPAQTIATNLSTAAKWREAWTAATLWQAYCSEQRGLWDDASVESVDGLKPVYDFASTRDPGIAKKYPALGQVVSAKSDIARRAAARKKAAKTKAAKPASAPVVTPVKNVLN